MFCVVWGYSNSKQKAKQYKQKTSPQSYKTQIKILAYPGLSWLLGFDQPGLIYIFLNYILKIEKTTLSSQKACFVIAHSLGEIMYTLSTI